jgi:hypothetical protein
MNTKNIKSFPFNNQNADEISGKMLNYASHSFFKKMQKICSLSQIMLKIMLA